MIHCLQPIRVNDHTQIIALLSHKKLIHVGRNHVADRKKWVSTLCPGCGWEAARLIGLWLTASAAWIVANVCAALPGARRFAKDYNCVRRSRFMNGVVFARSHAQPCSRGPLQGSPRPVHARLGLFCLTRVRRAQASSRAFRGGRSSHV